MPERRVAELLRVESLRAGYGEAVVVQGVDFALAEGESLALLGRNGTGKTTLLNTLVGVTRRHGGRITLAGRDVTALAPHARAAAGIGWVPQERNIFRSLTVDENLTAVARPGPWTPARVYAMFPRLEERKANMGSQLSGGEQQMLAVARALVLNPKLLLLDEPLEGLAPIIVKELLASIAKVVRDEGVSAIIVEQNPRQILPITSRAVILDRGAIVHEASSVELLADRERLDRWLAVDSTPAIERSLASKEFSRPPAASADSERTALVGTSAVSSAYRTDI